jgi:hypothetical protein
MIVVGGVYREECVVPEWSRIFGSGGRAAAVLSGLSDHVSLHAYVSQVWAEDAQTSFQSLGVTAHLHPIAADIAFHYFHPMSVAEMQGCPATPAPPIEVSGDAVLHFGFVEGSAVVHAKRCVFDPQNADAALLFCENGSTADALAVVLNETELRESTNADGVAAIRALRRATGAEVVVIKRGPRGAEVHSANGTDIVPARMSPEVFKIGSGDVFSAVFAHYWAEKDADPAVAAEAASYAAAQYVATRDLLGLSDGVHELPPAPTGGQSGPIYLAAPFFNIAQRWMVEQVREALFALGSQVFSPLHEIGTAGTAASIAAGDLKGLHQCQSMLAIVDGEDAGTLFEIGYARSKNIPVVVLAENPRRETLTMLEGSGCKITRDLTTAVYHAVWAALK